jgi:hypothetical protein
MPYTVPPADLTVGPRIAAQGIQSAASSLNSMFSMMGQMYMQDRVAGAQIDAFKQAGYFQDQPGKPGSAMMSPALYSAAQKGPLGTKVAINGVLQNYLMQQYKMRLALQQHAQEQGGFANPQGTQPQRPAPTQQPLYDRQNGPPSTAGGMNLNQPAQSSPANSPGGPYAPPVSEDDAD